jgi:asparagine synthetase B (glutamine-hydrolysing)
VPTIVIGPGCSIGAHNGIVALAGITIGAHVYTGPRVYITDINHGYEHLDEPIGDPAAINSYLICTAAREAGVKVLLSGMGADELFGGYRKHAANLLASRYQALPSALRRPIPRRLDRLRLLTQAACARYWATRGTAQ